MIRILFICHGNICRSPMAEFMAAWLINTAGLGERVSAASAAVSDEECGNPVYPPARSMLAAHGIGCAGKTARQMIPADYDAYDLLIAMDRDNLRRMRRICGGDPDGKMHLLLDYTDMPRDVADPWYTGDFQATWDDLTRGITSLLTQLCPDAAPLPPFADGGKK